jgi:hypothetical protein
MAAEHHLHQQQRMGLEAVVRLICARVRSISLAGLWSPVEAAGHLASVTHPPRAAMQATPMEAVVPSVWWRL